MKALMVYESMFGNTEKVARAVAAGLAESLEVEVHEVSTAPEQVIGLVDLIVVGAPTHAFSLSRPSTRADALAKGATRGQRDLGVREWLTGLRGRSHSELMAAFDTRAERVRRLPGSAAHKAAKLARHRGFELAGVESFYVSDIAGPLLPGELERATAWGRELASSMSSRSPGQPVR
ncbi:MAG: hypothetical protein QOF53_3765 [Nocardioidaceae bacterium]|jgi:hypothetical protein|nr:hypothetical protein [Nocardioidaceae bacterium]